MDPTARTLNVIGKVSRYLMMENAQARYTIQWTHNINDGMSIRLPVWFITKNTTCRRRMPHTRLSASMSFAASFRVY